MMEARRILSTDTSWHSPFFAFAAANFRGSDAARWQAWCDRGGWMADYEVFALVDGARIVSSIGRTRMQLVVNGEPRAGYQVGAVATLEPYRRQGLARRLMGQVIDALDDPDQPLILFANNSVLEFYPCFGFRRISQRRSTARVAIEPGAARAPRCDPANAADRARLAKLCARAQPIRGALAARDYYPVLLWHLTCRPVTAFWLDELDAVIAATAEGERLVLHDVIATRPFELGPVIARLIVDPITELEFRFEPEDWWPTATHAVPDDAESPLFVRGGTTSIVAPVRFPEMAHT
jgi:predicted N-acetyltransferase YhbS